jgi:hypothetical protein
VQEEDTAPIVHEESIKPAAPVEETKEEPVIDISGNQQEQQGGKLEVETPEEKVVEEKEPEPLIAPPPTPTPVSTTPTIIVETEPPSVGFTHMDAILDTDNPEKSTIKISNQMDDDEQQEITHIDYDESEAPETVNEFEELEFGDETLAVGEDEFETL